MRLSQERLPNGVYKIALGGALDIAGAAEADQPFRSASEKERKLIVDLTDVDFLASIGIRVLVKSAKTVAERGGRMAVYGAQEASRKVLVSSGVERLVNLVDDEAAAIAQVDR
jgi:anti-sigma B factor antagonist